MSPDNHDIIYQMADDNVSLDVLCQQEYSFALHRSKIYKPTTVVFRLGGSALHERH